MNVWTVAGLRRNELRNGGVLSWLLDPKGTHGLTDKVAAALFKRAAHAPRWLVQRTSYLDLQVATEECPLGSDENRIDISILGSDFVMFIEVKIDASEGHEQLKRYVDAVEEKRLSHGKERSLVLFLTKRKSFGNLPPAVATASWSDVELALRAVSESLPASDQRRLLLKQFASHIRTF
jgi:hypothetical protein